MKLNEPFTTALILAHFYAVQKKVIETDASDSSLQAISCQFQDKTLHPLGFLSRKLNSAEDNYEIHDKQLLVILEALMEWKHYLYGADNLFFSFSFFFFF